MTSTAKSVFYYSFYMLGMGLSLFFRISVIERIVFFFGMVGIVLFLRANPLLALIGSVDLLGAIWTALTLRNQH